MSPTRTRTSPPPQVFNKRMTSMSTSLRTPPEKRRNVNLESNNDDEKPRCFQYDVALSKSSSREKTLECRRNTTHSVTELYRWTFTQAAVIPVRVKHIFEMDHEDSNQGAFYWMGLVPCRTVKVVGIIIGVDEYDDMKRYNAVDDGTAVIDCDFKLPKQSLKQSSTLGPRRSKPLPSHATETLKSPNPNNYTVPQVSVGTFLTAKGLICQGRGSRYLRLEASNFAVCGSANDEPRHWMEVAKLERDYYNLHEPFTIPKIEQDSESKDVHSNVLPTSTTPSSPVTQSSPCKTDASRSTTSSPQRPRLRHPSRLRSRDLTDVTFRIYLKHYMDFAPTHCPIKGMLSVDDENWMPDPCATPTPKTRRKFSSPSQETPKPRKHARKSEEREDAVEDVAQYGFTLSYLRRVPVLAEMARAVVVAEGRRREKEKRKQEKEKASRDGQIAKSEVASSSRRATRNVSNPSLVSRNMKRLFQKTIRDLYKDGSIIIWNGPARPCNRALHSDDSISGSDGIWKSSARETSLLSTVDTTASSASSRLQLEDCTVEELSDPDENEESYLPVTARTIAGTVIHALRNMTGAQSTSRRKHRPPTAEELTLHLQQSDAQWANLGSWNVQAALEWLLSEDRVFKAGNDRWALCN